MMTFILIASFFLIAFVGLLRYDVHKHKYAKPEKNKSDTSGGSSDNNKNDESSSDGDGGD